MSGTQIPLRYSERELRTKANRVIAGTQSGTYKKAEMARDILTLLDRIERMRTTPDRKTKGGATEAGAIPQPTHAGGPGRAPARPTAAEPPGA